MYTKILLPVDGSPESDAAVEQAVKLASVCDASLAILYVTDVAHYCNGFEPAKAYPQSIIPHMRQVAHSILSRAMACAATAHVAATSAEEERICADVATLIVDRARTLAADLIVMGTHGRHGIDRFFLGSLAEEVARSSPVPVLLAKAPAIDRQMGMPAAVPGGIQASLAAPSAST